MEIYCPKHAEEHPCSHCGGTGKAVVSVGDEYGYEFCSECLWQFIGMIHGFYGPEGHCGLCDAEREAAKEEGQ